MTDKEIYKDEVIRERARFHELLKRRLFAFLLIIAVIIIGILWILISSKIGAVKDAKAREESSPAPDSIIDVTDDLDTFIGNALDNEEEMKGRWYRIQVTPSYLSDTNFFDWYSKENKGDSVRFMMESGEAKPSDTETTVTVVGSFAYIARWTDATCVTLERCVIEQ